MLPSPPFALFAGEEGEGLREKEGVAVEGAEALREQLWSDC